MPRSAALWIALLLLVPLAAAKKKTNTLDGGIPLTLGLTCLIFFVGFMVMQYLRPRLYFFYYPRLWSPGDEKPFWLSFENCTWILRTIMTGKDDVSVRTGLHGLLYLRFELFMLFYVLVMAALALPILLPLNIAAQGGLHGFAETTATNIEEGSSYFAAHTVLTIVFVLFGLLLVWWYQRMYFRSRKLARSRDFVNSHTLKIAGIPRDAVEGEVRAFFESLYPDEVASVHLAVDARDLVALKQRKLVHLKALSHAEWNFSKTGERPMANPGTGGWLLVRLGVRAPEDAMAYHRAAIVDISSQIERRQKFERRSTGTAFVTFRSAVGTHQVLRDFYLWSERRALLNGAEDQDLRRRLKADKWRVDPAERPQNVFWDHLAYGTLNKICRRAIVFTCVFIIAVLWSVPIAFLASVHTLQNIPGLGLVVSAVIGFNPFFRDIIEGFLPSLMTTLFVLLLPFILLAVVPFEKPSSVSERDASILRLYYTFIIFNVLIFPTFFIGTLDAIAEGYQEGANDIVGNINFSLQSAFYINYVIQQTFFSGMSRLVRPDDVVTYKILTKLAVTDAERLEVRRNCPGTMKFRIRFAQMLLVLACLLTFAVICPLLLVAGILYFVVIHFIDKNLLLHVYPRELAGDSSITNSVINMFGIALLIYEVLTAIFFWFKESVWSFAVLIALMAITLLIMAILNFLNWYNRYRYIKYDRPLLIEWNMPPELLEKAYLHPGMEEEPVDLSSRLDHFVNGKEDELDALMHRDVDLATQEYLQAEKDEDAIPSPRMFPSVSPRGHPDDLMVDGEGLAETGRSSSSHDEESA